MASRIITQDELKQHNTEKDAWISIHGNVYNVTSFVEDHPGGPDIVLNHAGGDATEDFEDMNHSLPARDQLKTLLVGVLEGAEVKDPSDVFKAGLKRNKEARKLGSKLVAESGDVGIWKYVYVVAIVVPAAIAAVWKYSH